MASNSIETKLDGKSRQEGIIALLDRHSVLTISALADQFGCTPATIRRDLIRIAEEGVRLEHYHGSVGLVREDLGSQFEAQRISHFEAKEAIAQLLVDFIPNDMTIGLNGGTTTLLIGRALAKAHKPVRVVTNAVNIAYELSMKDMDVVIVGGAVRRPNFESTGQLALRTLSGMHVDLTILGAEGVDSQFGFSTTAEDEAAVARVFRDCSDAIVMAVDKSKLGKKALFRLLGWDDVNYVAVDWVNSALLQYLADVEVAQKSSAAQVWRTKR